MIPAISPTLYASRPLGIPRNLPKSVVIGRNGGLYRKLPTGPQTPANLDSRAEAWSGTGRFRITAITMFDLIPLI
jgi:hypothetical protein